MHFIKIKIFEFWNFEIFKRWANIRFFFFFFFFFDKHHHKRTRSSRASVSTIFFVILSQEDDPRGKKEEKDIVSRFEDPRDFNYDVTGSSPFPGGESRTSNKGIPGLQVIEIHIFRLLGSSSPRMNINQNNV